MLNTTVLDPLIITLFSACHLTALDKTLDSISLPFLVRSSGESLCTLKDDIELPIPIEDIQIQSIEPKKLISFLKAMEFRTLTEKKAKEFNLSSAKIDTQEIKLNFIPKEDVYETKAPLEDIKKFDYDLYSTIQNIDQLNEWKEKISEKGYVAIDTETDSLNAIEANLIGFSFAISNNEACYIPIKHLEKSPQIELNQALVILKEIMEDQSIFKILHNKKSPLSLGPCMG